jgi:hypothetical protein
MKPEEVYRTIAPVKVSVLTSANKALMMNEEWEED